jgi:hypothetical protein
MLTPQAEYELMHRLKLIFEVICQTRFKHQSQYRKLLGAKVGRYAPFACTAMRFVWSNTPACMGMAKPRKADIISTLVHMEHINF